LWLAAIFDYRLNHSLPLSAIFNLCMPYASRDEMATAVQSAVRQSLEKNPDTEPYVSLRSLVITHITFLRRQISVEDIDSQLMTSLGGSPPLDIVIRTSGVKRLSDFLLWQVRNLLRMMTFLRSDSSLRSAAKVPNCISRQRIGQISDCGI
jgi:hypothetical protein